MSPLHGNHVSICYWSHTLSPHIPGCPYHPRMSPLWSSDTSLYPRMSGLFLGVATAWQTGPMSYLSIHIPGCLEYTHCMANWSYVLLVYTYPRMSGLFLGIPTALGYTHCMANWSYVLHIPGCPHCIGHWSYKSSHISGCPDHPRMSPIHGVLHSLLTSQTIPNASPMHGHVLQSLLTSQDVQSILGCPQYMAASYTVFSYPRMSRAS